MLYSVKQETCVIIFSIYFHLQRIPEKRKEEKDVREESEWKKQKKMVKAKIFEM